MGATRRAAQRLMRVSIRHREGVTILELEGRIEQPEGPAAMRAAMEKILTAGSMAILVDLEKAFFGDNGGFGELVAAFVSTTNRGGQLKLLNPSQKTLDVLALSQLTQVLEIFYDEAEAIESFDRSPVGPAWN